MEVPAAPLPAPAPEKSDRQAFFDLNFNELDRGLTAEERQEWNSIYASYRGRSALTGKIISVRNKQTGNVERQTMYCAVVVPYRVRIVIPASEMWGSGQERPDFVLQNMVGATIDFIVIKVDREAAGGRPPLPGSTAAVYSAICRTGRSACAATPISTRTPTLWLAIL